MKKISLFGFISVLILLVSCAPENLPNKPYKTEFIVVLIVDGPRYTETWGEPTHQYIPFMDSVLAPESCIHSYFYNDGITNTTNGHCAITSGYYQSLNNQGQQLPFNPSFFQHWLKQNEGQNNKAWIVASKDKLATLGNCESATWSNRFLPATDCGISGIGSGYRHDTITFQRTLSLLANTHPKLLLVNFREPDFSGHQANWPNYLDGIRNTDKYVHEIWKFIQNDPVYKDKTTLFVTNDHGRHLDGIADGFVSHGDNCEGCRRIHLLSFGPDFKSGFVTDEQRNLVDVHATIIELLQLKEASTSGDVMIELFK